MALRTPDLVRETTTTTGTGAYTPGGALPGFRAITDAIASSDTMYYRAIMGTSWEIGLGTWNGTTLARTSVLLSTNSNAAVNWGAGTKILHSVAPEAILAAFLTLDGSRNMTGNLTIAKAQPQLILDATGVSSASLVMKSDTLNRFNLFTSGASLNLFWWRYDDAGANIGTIMQVTRLTGEIGINGAPNTGVSATVRAATTDGVTGRGMVVQNGDNSTDSSIDIRLVGANMNNIRARLRGQRVGATSNGKLVISAYTGTTEVEVASFNNDGSITNVGSGAKYDAFPSGTRLLFQQTTVPAGWTKDTSLNDRALRVVSGSVGTGGTLDFSAAMTSRGITGSVGAHALAWNEMPVHSHSAWTDTQGSHQHTYGDGLNVALANQGTFFIYPSGAGGGNYIGYTGSQWTSAGGNHAHNVGVGNAGANWGHAHNLSVNNLDMTIKYVDAVVGQKD